MAHCYTPFKTLLLPRFHSRFTLVPQVLPGRLTYKHRKGISLLAILQRAHRCSASTCCVRPLPQPHALVHCCVSACLYPATVLPQPLPERLPSPTTSTCLPCCSAQLPTQVKAIACAPFHSACLAPALPHHQHVLDFLHFAHRTLFRLSCTQLLYCHRTA